MPHFRYRTQQRHRPPRLEPARLARSATFYGLLAGRMAPPSCTAVWRVLGPHMAENAAMLFTPFLVSPQPSNKRPVFSRHQFTDCTASSPAFCLHLVAFRRTLPPVSGDISRHARHATRRCPGSCVRLPVRAADAAALFGGSTATTVPFVSIEKRGKLPRGGQDDRSIWVSRLPIMAALTG